MFELSQVTQMIPKASDESAWVLQVFLIVFLTLFANYVIRKVFDRLALELKKTKNLWDDALLASGRKPARYLMWLIGIALAMKIIERHESSDFFQFVDPLFDLSLIVLIAWFSNNFIREAENNLLTPGYTREPMDETTVTAIGRLLRVSVNITTVLIILQTFGYSISGVLAFGGIGGIAVGFAAKDLLANFFGGLMLYLDRPFKVGDWIRSPDREIEGTVEQIGWRLTTIRTFDKRPLYVPNSVFANIAVENPSRMNNRRIYEVMGIRYDDADKMATIIERVKLMLIEHEDIDNRQTMIVNFNFFGPSSLDFFVYTFTKTTDWIYFHEIKQDVLLKISNIVAEEGAEFAFPTSTVHVLGDASNGPWRDPNQSVPPPPSPPTNP